MFIVEDDEIDSAKTPDLEILALIYYIVAGLCLCGGGALIGMYAYAGKLNWLNLLTVTLVFGGGSIILYQRAHQIGKVLLSRRYFPYEQKPHP